MASSAITSVISSSKSEDTSLFLNLDNSVSCKIHPLVLFSILDHFIRRSEGQERVVGTLLGLVDGSTIEITNCFPVPHRDEEPKGSLDMKFHASMRDLHTRTSGKETVVGWYATGSEINQQSVFFNNFYWKELQRSPVHLTLDTDFEGKSGMSVKTYLSHHLTFSLNPETSLGSQFQPIEHTISAFGAESIGVDAVLQADLSSTAQPVDLQSDIATIRDNFSQLVDILSEVAAYVDDVVQGKTPADPKVGRFLSKAISSLPLVDPSGFQKMFTNSLQDLLMVVYLANLTRAQLAITDRLEFPRQPSQ